VRPLHRVLEEVWPFLNKGDGTHGDFLREPYICYALYEARREGRITIEEYRAACDLVVRNVANLGSGMYLITAAKQAGLVPLDVPATSLLYVEWRNRWLRRLIDREKVKYEADARSA